MTRIIAVDHGNSEMKTVHVGFASGIRSFMSKPSLATEYLKFRGKYYVLTSERTPYKEDKTTDDTYFALTLFALIKELKACGEYKKTDKVTLAVGLPPEHFSRQKDNFRKYFQRYGREIDFELNGRVKKISLERIFVYPQGYAALFSKQNIIQSANRMFCVDIGGYTVDVQKVVKGVPDLSLSRSLSLGVITLYNDAISQVKTDTGKTIHEQHVESFLRDDEDVKRLAEDIKKSLANVTSRYLEMLSGKLLELGVDPRVETIYFCGGGAILLHSAIIRTYGVISNHLFSLDAKCNAIGYHQLAEHQSQKRGA